MQTGGSGGTSRGMILIWAPVKSVATTCWDDEVFRLCASSDDVESAATCSTPEDSHRRHLLSNAGAQNTLPAPNQELLPAHDLLYFSEHTFCLSSTQQPLRRVQEDLLHSRCKARRGLSITSHIPNPCSLITSLSIPLHPRPARFHSFQRRLTSLPPPHLSGPLYLEERRFLISCLYHSPSRTSSATVRDSSCLPRR
jgi:hypothetical protein